MKRIILISILSLLALVFASFWVILWMPNSFDGDRFIKISKGESFAAVVDSLEHAGIIRSRLTLELAGRILDLTTKMQIGKYRFKDGMSNTEVLEDIRHGKTIEMISVTIPEGLRATRHAQIFRRQLGIDSAWFMSLVNDEEFARSLGIDAPSLEGYLMPNTYRVYWQSDEKELIQRMVGEFWGVLDSSLQLRARHQGMTVNQIVILASIVEGETRVDSERAIVAGVYVNRLRRRMHLQADPTIQYILEEGPRRLRRSDYQLRSPYNTYLNYGLPPGPVNNPGRAAILASLWPRSHRYLFFVADGEGGHKFTRSFNEHRRAVREYLRRREEQKLMR